MLQITLINYFFSEILSTYILVILWLYSIVFLIAYEFLLRSTRYIVATEGIIIKHPFVKPKLIPFSIIKDIKIEKAEKAYKELHLKFFRLFIGLKRFLSERGIVVIISDPKAISELAKLSLRPDLILLMPSNPVKFVEMASKYIPTKYTEF